MSKNYPSISGIIISTDSEGRFNLNALHKASGEGESKEPNRWLRLASTQELITELGKVSTESELPPYLEVAQELIKVTKGGTAPGTFAHELLAIEYAGWISPKFRLRVNQTFIDYRTGKLHAPIQKKDESLPALRRAKALQIQMQNTLQIFNLLPNLSDNSRQQIMAQLINPIAGAEVFSLPVIEEKHYSATEIGDMFGVSAQKIGRISTQLDLKRPEFGEYRLSKSMYSDKQVETWVYNENGVNAFRMFFAEAVTV